MSAPTTARNAPQADSHASLRDHEGTFTYPDREPSRARVQALHRDAGGRTARAVRTWAICWGLAVVAVFLPVLHFVLVPALLAAGPLLGWQALREHVTLVRAEGHCPGCGAVQQFTLGTGWRERTILRCEACGRRIQLVLPSRSAKA